MRPSWMKKSSWIYLVDPAAGMKEVLHVAGDQWDGTSGNIFRD